MMQRLRLIIRGAVQGVGFRPFVYRLAKDLDLPGYVNNSSLGVFIEVEGERSKLDRFLELLKKDKPVIAVITGLEHSYLDPVGYKEFEIVESTIEQKKSVVILPDIAVCEECLKEMVNPSDRRYLYPFINCTNCGPRFSITEKLPYDRPNTSMKSFEMCDECKAEYSDPSNRRFHAQPVACPVCGPQVELRDNSGKELFHKEEALRECIKLLKEGSIVALKGLGGYQLICNAKNDDAVKLLRERKHREEKPFAVMLPNLESIKNICEVSSTEERLLLSPEAPIVLLKKRNNAAMKYLTSFSVAPANPYLGVMLPYTPLHHIILKELDLPVVATSGNIAEEPICITEEEAFNKLSGIADYFLVHNRPIVRHVDDSIVRIVAGREMVTRRARGYAPFPIMIGTPEENVNGINKNKTILAVGGHLKNTIALKVEDNVFVSQHIGDLATEASMNAFEKVITDFKDMYNTEPDLVVHDNHPEYLSTKYAMNNYKDSIGTQHHFAHIASCRAENQLTGKTLGVSWDGTGYGLDGAIWGGEFFLSDDQHYQHVAQFRTFRLPGGEIAIKEARRSALGMLFEVYGKAIFEDYIYLISDKFSASEIKVIQNMMEKNINTPVTSSAGRMFDAVSSLLNISHVTSYEGKSAMMLEFAVDKSEKEYYHFGIRETDKFIIDWEIIIISILGDLEAGLEKGTIAAKFHNTMAQIILRIAKTIGEEKVVLSGGCFQNAVLLEKTIELLDNEKYKVYRHQRIPTNDGGISLGQIAAAGVLYKPFDINEFTKVAARS